jgi:hypothetical protein
VTMSCLHHPELQIVQAQSGASRDMQAHHSSKAGLHEYSSQRQYAGQGRPRRSCL